MISVLGFDCLFFAKYSIISSQPDVAFPLQPPELLNCSTRKASLSVIHSLLHDEIDSFCKQVQH